MPDCSGVDRSTPHPLILGRDDYCMTCGRGPFNLVELAGGDENTLVRLVADLKPVPEEL